MSGQSDDDFIFERCMGCQLECPYIDGGLDPWLIDFAAALSLARQGVRSRLFQWCSLRLEKTDKCGKSGVRQVNDE